MTAAALIPASQAEFLMELTATLAEDAKACVMPVGEHGTPMQVLVLKVAIGGAQPSTATLHQVFPAKHPNAAHAAAARLRKGQRISFQTSTAHMHVHYPNVQHIHQFKAEEARHAA